MELILLAGNSKSNKEWIEEVETKLKDLFDKTYVQYYKHWKTGKEIIDFDLEIKRLENYLKDKKDYIIFAKSAGIILALKGIKDYRLMPSKCIFLGFPYNWAKENNFPVEFWLNNFKVKSIFIQKSKDPAISAKDLRDLLKENKVANHELDEIPGEDHIYSDLGKIVRQTKRFLKG